MKKYKFLKDYSTIINVGGKSPYQKATWLKDYIIIADDSNKDNPIYANTVSIQLDPSIVVGAQKVAYIPISQLSPPLDDPNNTLKVNKPILEKEGNTSNTTLDIIKNNKKIIIIITASLVVIGAVLYIKKRKKAKANG
jgi:hypothetical protein